MKKDINPPKVENIIVAVIQEENEFGITVWNVYLINNRQQEIENVLVSARGYLTNTEGEHIKTSMLRHGLGNIKPNTYALIEPIKENVFALHNEFLVSFFIKNLMYDKKYIFLAETIKEANFINVPIISKRGVMIM